MNVLSAQALVAPNIFDAYANANLLLYLVAGNLLSPATWDLSRKIQRRVQDECGTDQPPARALVKEVQTIIDRSFRHLHASEVAEIYGELSLASESARLGEQLIDSALRRILQTFEERIETGRIPREGLQPTIDRLKSGHFPAYAYGNIDLVRANRRLTGKSRASVRGLTSCVDETAIFAALVMTLPKGSIANVVALSSPSHSSAFGWNSDGEPWWFYGKNRLYFTEDWRQHVAEAEPDRPQAAFNRLLADADRIVSVAGCFDFGTGESDLPDDHVTEIISKMDEFFGVRLEQTASALAKQRVPRREDPIASCLRELLGTPSIGDARAALESREGSVAQDVLLSFRSLRVKDAHPYLVVARQQPNSLRMTQAMSSVEDAVRAVSGITEATSIFDDRDRIAMPDETLRFGLGTDRDKALLLHVLAEHLLGRLGGRVEVRTLLGDSRSFVQIGELLFDAGSCQRVSQPSEPIWIELGK